jgi:hypothetical protein
MLLFSVCKIRFFFITLRFNRLRSKQLSIHITLGIQYTYMLMYVVRDPSVPKWDRDGNLTLTLTL